ncbi:hypothetical protein MML48_8g00007059 [Holotrichia oblita]|uniref:Uncharacterized protein n=3 Tax=Holotrichia oblita TaxID=644536 RepID=A0ACB9SPY1_HOLOL|nr:hypothetical protein MML48_8g00021323 [Holotrichia oblita]KAI4456555.1 hypothetical protein MML48_8g00012839 [Holotrichia oblita]KAI4456561.1 hypothetical protein MML48_8g00007059 [Holotrichia oblita]
MEWPSKSIPCGGVFQPSKVQYSQETKNYLKLLMDESRLNNNIRQKINYALRDGDPLPNLHSSRSDRGRRIERQPPVLFRPGSSRRRTYSEIINSGAYERDKFVPDRTKEDREILKTRLQNIMANGKESLKKPVVQKIETKAKDKPEMNKFDELKQEIEERQIWLKEMEEIGEGHKYREVINLQIQARLRELNKLKSNNQKCKGDSKK